MILPLLCPILFVAASPEPARAGQDLPVLRAHSPTIDVRDGTRLQKGKWTADPSLALDTYAVQRSRARKTVTFQSDLGSLSFDVEPGGSYEFLVLLDDKPCRTRISARARSAQRAAGQAGPETIPLAFEHGKLHLSGRLNGSQPLDLLFDTGADTTVLYPSGARKGAHLVLDGTTLNVGTGGATTRGTSSDNTLAIGGLCWEHESVLSIEKQADEADGIVGYNVFEDKVLELDFERMQLLVHDALPPLADSFSKVALLWQGGLTAVDGTFGNGALRATGPLVLDTGGSGTLMVGQALLEQNGLRGTLEVLGTSVSRGVGSGTLRNELVLVPELELAGFTLANVPAHMQLGSTSTGGTLCLDVLDRFHLLIDYTHDEAWFRPNTRFHEPFERPGSFRERLPLVLGAVLLVLALVFAVRRLRGNSVPRAS